ncbi:MAG: DUF4190 domain-containing protein [Thermoplasmatota archaeon]
MAVCPYCRSNVTPQRDAAGRLVCPACFNTGQLQFSAPDPNAWTQVPAAPPAMVPGQAAGANAPGAVAALVLGLIGLIPFWGLVCAILGIVFGFQAKRRIRESGGRLEGDGMALAGIVARLDVTPEDSELTNIKGQR